MTEDERVEYYAAHGHGPEVADLIAVDFDGTLYPRAPLMDRPAPLPGAVEAIRRLRSAGYRIVILTSRVSPEWCARSGHPESEQREYVEELLHRDGIPHDFVTAEKVPAAAYIDDLAIRFDGDWPAVADWLLWSRHK